MCRIDSRIGRQMPLDVVIDEEAYNQILAHAYLRDALVGGVLVGSAYEDYRGIHSKVAGAIEATRTHETDRTIMFTKETWTAVHEVMKRDFPSEELIGWYHSVLGENVALSMQSRFVQENFFCGPEQFALVFSSPFRMIGLYSNTPQGIEPLHRFAVRNRAGFKKKVDTFHGIRVSRPSLWRRFLRALLPIG